MTVSVRETTTGAHRIIVSVGNVLFQSQRLYSPAESKEIVSRLNTIAGSKTKKKGGK